VLICDDLLYVVADNEHVYALDFAGQVIWEYQFEDGLNWLLAASPTTKTLYFRGAVADLGDDSEYHVRDWRIYGIGTDGTLRWRTAFGDDALGLSVVETKGGIYTTVLKDIAVLPSLGWRNMLYLIAPDGTAHEVLPNFSPLSMGPGGILYALECRTWNVLYALEEDASSIEEPSKIGRVIKDLKHDDWRVRWNTVLHLGETGDIRAVEPLAAALKDEDPDVQWVAAYSLERISKPAVPALMAALKDYVSAEPAGAALVRIGEPAVGPLTVLFDDENADVRARAVRVLVAMGESGVDGLIVALKHDDADVRKHAVSAVTHGEARSPRLVEPLIAALNDVDPHVRYEAVDALGRMEDTRAVDPLIAALGDQSVDVRIYAAEVLGRIGDVRAVEALSAALKDEKRNVRCSAAAALGDLKDVRAVQPLIDALGDEDQYVRSAAVEALRQIAQESLGEDPEKWQKWWEESKPNP